MTNSIQRIRLERLKTLLRMRKFSEFYVIRKLIVVFIYSRNLSSVYRYFITALRKVNVKGIFNIMCTMHSVEINLLNQLL